jgi:hypothetical protein
MSRTLQREQSARHAISGHLRAWSPEEAIEAGRDVAALIEHPGFRALERSFELRERALLSERLTKPASDNAAEYAQALGVIDGLRQLRPLAQGVVENRRSAEEALRQREERPNG